MQQKIPEKSDTAAVSFSDLFFFKLKIFVLFGTRILYYVVAMLSSLNIKTVLFYNYNGSLTDPPCTEVVQWRVLMDPLVISPAQLNRIELLTAMYLYPVTCQLGTWGKPHDDSSCKVDLNRPLQFLSKKHVMKDCLANHAGEWWVVQNSKVKLDKLPTVNVTKHSKDN